MSTFRGCITSSLPNNCSISNRRSFSLIFALPGKRRYTTHYFQSSLCSHSTKHHGSVIQRSESPTHLDQIEDAIESSLSQYQEDQSDIVQNNSILEYPPQVRETIGVATNIKKRLQGLANSGDCRRCWLQKRHCICEQCLPLEGNRDEGGSDWKGIPNVNRLFLLVSF